MSKAQQTKTHIVEQAAALFNQQGYAGASMADLMRVTGLQKGGIYNHFRSKDELALAAFDFAVDRIQQRFRGALRSKRHAVDRLLAMLTVYEDFIEQPPLRGGCPLLNTAVDSDDAHPALRSRTQQAMDSWRSLIERIVAKGVARRELHPTADPETVASVVIATIEGGIMLSKLYDDPAHLDRALNHLANYVQHQLATRD